MSKGTNMSIQTVVMILVGLVLAGLLVGTVSNVFDQGDNTTGDAVNNASDDASRASCVQSCRQEYPLGGSDFRDCRGDCS